MDSVESATCRPGCGPPARVYRTVPIATTPSPCRGVGNGGRLNHTPVRTSNASASAKVAAASPPTATTWPEQVAAAARPPRRVGRSGREVHRPVRGS
jgi:hypothetical protein